MNTTTTITAATTAAENLNADERKLVAAALCGGIEPWAAFRWKDEAARGRIIRALTARFGEFGIAAARLESAANRALARGSLRAEAAATRRLGNIDRWLAAVAPRGGGWPAGVLRRGDGDLVFSVAATRDGLDEGSGFTVRFAQSGDPLAGGALPSLPEAMSELISAHEAVFGDGNEADLEIRFEGFAGDDYVVARSEPLSLNDARAVLAAGVLVMREL